MADVPLAWIEHLGRIQVQAKRMDGMLCMAKAQARLRALIADRTQIVDREGAVTKGKFRIPGGERIAIVGDDRDRDRD